MRLDNSVVGVLRASRAVSLMSVAVIGLTAGTAHATGTYSQTNLVSNRAGVAVSTDPNLRNPWGVVFNPTGFSWVSDNHSGRSTLYDGLGNINSLVVDIASPNANTGGATTGIVFSGGTQFQVSDGTRSGASRFLFAGEDGVISGWAPNVTTSRSLRGADRSGVGAVYKGLGIDTTGTGSLFAADFHNGRIDRFDGSFNLAAPSAAFTDPTLPAGFAPFNVRNLGGKIYVTYAKQDVDGQDDVPGAGNGFVDVYDTGGNLLNRLVSGGDLNSPWGLAIAPANFGALSGALLVGNFGDGLIHGYDPITGASRGTLTDASGNAIHIEGLWGIEFGNGFQNQPTNTLFFAAGPNGEADGLYGRIDAVPAPAGLALVGGAMGLVAARRRR